MMSQTMHCEAADNDFKSLDCRFCMYQVSRRRGDFDGGVMGCVATRGQCNHTPDSASRFCSAFEPLNGGVEVDDDCQEPLSTSYMVRVAEHPPKSIVVSSVQVKEPLWAVYYNADDDSLLSFPIVALNMRHDIATSMCGVILFEGRLIEVLLEQDPEHGFIAVSTSPDIDASLWRQEIDRWAELRDTAYEEAEI